MRNFFCIVFLLIFILSSCSKSVIKNYIKNIDTSQLVYFYADKSIKEKINYEFVKVLELPKDVRFVKPYNSLIILEAEDTLADYLKNLAFVKIKQTKDFIILDNTLSGVDIKTFFRNYSSTLKLPNKLFVNDLQKAKSFANKISLFPKKCEGTPCSPNEKYKGLLDRYSRIIMSGKAYGIYYYETKEHNYILPSEKDIYESFSACNIIRLSDGLVILPSFIFDKSMIDTLNRILEDTLIKRVYSNNYIIKNFLPEDKHRAWLPRKYKNGKKNNSFYKEMTVVDNYLDRYLALVVYFYNINDTSFPSSSQLQKYLGDQNFIYFPQGIIIKSRFAHIPYIIDTIINKFKQDTMSEKIFTNRVYVLRSLLERKGVENTRIGWSPKKCTYIDTTCKPIKSFRNKMYLYKLRLESRKALWVYFKKIYDLEFPNTDFIKSYFRNCNIIETNNIILITSPYYNSTMINELKEKIIPLYYNPNFSIYSNKAYVLSHLINKDYNFMHLPVLYNPKNYSQNKKVDGQLRRVKREIIVDNALVVYFVDPTDSIHPSQSYIRQSFKYMKFYNFKEGFVIGAYLDH